MIRIDHKDNSYQLVKQSLTQVTLSESSQIPTPVKKMWLRKERKETKRNLHLKNSKFDPKKEKQQHSSSSTKFVMIDYQKNSYLEKKSMDWLVRNVPKQHDCDKFEAKKLQT